MRFAVRQVVDRELGTGYAEIVQYPRPIGTWSRGQSAQVVECRRTNGTWFRHCYDTVCKTGPNGRSNAWNQDIRLSGGRR